MAHVFVYAYMFVCVCVCVFSWEFICEITVNTFKNHRTIYSISQSAKRREIRLENGKNSKAIVNKCENIRNFFLPLLQKDNKKASLTAIYCIKCAHTCLQIYSPSHLVNWPVDTWPLTTHMYRYVQVRVCVRVLVGRGHSEMVAAV